jgi:proteasome assembly chaperone (PAC2) family protein
VALYTLENTDDLVAPIVVAAFDSWVDAGSASTGAATHLAGEGDVVATFDPDILYDYRARRPTLEILDGRASELTWPELTMRRAHVGDRDLLIFTGPEPDFHWRELSESVLELSRRLDVAQWISLGAIPAAVPHTRPVPLLGTESRRGLLRGDVQPGPDGVLRVPAAAISILDVAVSRAGIDAVGYFAQVPHYVSGPYPAATVALLAAVGSHIGTELEMDELDEEARALRTRLDAATAAEESTRAYVERLESMVDESRLPSGGDLISEIERFLRDRGGESNPRPDGPR